MKTNIIRMARASLIAITLTVLLVGGCTTLAADKTAKAKPAPAVAAATPAPALTPAPVVAPNANGIVTHVVTNAPASVAATKGMDGGVPCLFVNKTGTDITLSASSTNKAEGTFTLELSARKNRTFNILPGQYKYIWSVGDDPKSYPTDPDDPAITLPATLTVEDKAVHHYDGIGMFHAKVVIFKGK